jgi:hypothetical protein
MASTEEPQTETATEAEKKGNNCKACNEPALKGSLFCENHQKQLVQRRKKRWFARVDVMLAMCLVALVGGYPIMKGRITAAIADYLENAEDSDEPGFFDKANELLARLIPEDAKRPDKDTKRIAAALRKKVLGGIGTTPPVVDHVLDQAEESGEPLSLDELIDKVQAMSGAERMGLTDSQLMQLQGLRGGGSETRAGDTGAPGQRQVPAKALALTVHGTTDARSTCGDGIVGRGEQCDGDALAGATCASLGFSGDCGQEPTCLHPGLACLSSCTFDYSGCTAESHTAVQRFVDHGDGTTTDRLTGLMWEQKCTERECNDRHNVLTALPWRDGAADWISGLNLERFAGHHDWRLPTLEELRTLLAVVPPCAAEPCPGTVWPRDQTAAAGYWSSTTFSVDKQRAWVVSFRDGDVYTAAKDDALHVRAVRRAF